MRDPINDDESWKLITLEAFHGCCCSCSWQPRFNQLTNEVRQPRFWFPGEEVVCDFGFRPGVCLTNGKTMMTPLYPNGDKCRENIPSASEIRWKNRILVSLSLPTNVVLWDTAHHHPTGRSPFKWTWFTHISLLSFFPPFVPSCRWYSIMIQHNDTAREDVTGIRREAEMRDEVEEDIEHVSLTYLHINVFSYKTWAHWL